MGRVSHCECDKNTLETVSLPDVGASRTVGLVVIPQRVAYAAMAGMPLLTGIYASDLPALAAPQGLDTAHASGAQAMPLHESAPQA